MLTGILWTSAALTSSGVTINALESPVWMQRDDIKTALSTGDEIRINDRLVTGDSGKLALQLESGTNLQLDANSEIEIIAFTGSDAETGEYPSAVKFLGGRACVQFQAQPESAGNLNLQFGDGISLVIHEQGHICVEFSDDLSSIVLVDGTVQITNSIEPSMVVLSEARSEYRFDDTGYFELRRMENDVSIEVGNDATAVLKAGIENGTSDNRKEATDSTETKKIPEDVTEISRSAVIGNSSAYVYTVYLFSTRSQEVANEVNQKLRDAGHPTRIITSEGEASVHYRIAVSGFPSRQAARDYSADIVGKYGIADTWIGRKKETD